MVSTLKRPHNLKRISPAPALLDSKSDVSIRSMHRVGVLTVARRYSPRGDRVTGGASEDMPYSPQLRPTDRDDRGRWRDDGCELRGSTHTLWRWCDVVRRLSGA